MHSGTALHSPAKASTPSQATPVVFVVDDDVSVRESLELLIRFAGWQPETFESAQEFLSRPRVLVPSCLILDVALPGLNGLDLQKLVAVERKDMPIIFITGYGDIPTTVEAMKGGAVEFLTKPFGDDVLLSAIKRALDRSKTALREETEVREAPRPLRVAQSSRATGHGIGGLRFVEQAGRGRTRDKRDHGEGASRPGHAENGSQVSRRSRENGCKNCLGRNLFQTLVTAAKRAFQRIVLAAR